MNFDDGLTATSLLAAAQSTLEGAGYKLIEPTSGQAAFYDQARILQNQYSVVMVASFETWESLAETWTDYQGVTVETMSRFLRQGDSKAADGYLVLLTPMPVSVGEIETTRLNRIRSDTSRLRKLVGTGDDLRTISDIRKVIAALIPLAVRPDGSSTDDSLDALPRILEQRNVEAAATKVVVDAFKANTPIMPLLHQFKNLQ